MNRHTLQSRQHSKSHRAEHFARLRARREAAILARPAPIYPPLDLPTGDWLGGCINGQTVILHLQREMWHRSDQWAAWIDGALVESGAGLTTLLGLLKHRWGRAPSRRLLAGLQQGYSGRDETDAASAS